VAQSEALSDALLTLLTIRRFVPWTLHVPMSATACWKAYEQSQPPAGSVVQMMFS
jgi:hypothetical protein